MKAKVDPRKAGLEVLSIRRTRKEEVLLILKKKGDFSVFHKVLEQVVGERESVSALVSMRFLEIKDLDETVEKEEVVAALRLALCRPTFDGYLQALHSLRWKIRIGWVDCRIREHAEVAWCFRCLGYGHMSRGCSIPDRKGACWKCSAAGNVAKDCRTPLRCLAYFDRGEKDIAHVSGSGSCPVFREELRRLRGGK